MGGGVSLTERMAHKLGSCRKTLPKDMPTAQIRVQAGFCAAFRLSQPEFTDEENLAAYGPCFSANYHGHNYSLWVTVSGPIDAQTGMVVDYVLLDAIIAEQVIDHVDHKNLNLDVPFMANLVPTSENLCAAFWPRIAGVLPKELQLVEISLQEDRDHQVIFRGPGV